jgi:hypothetical protein
VSFYILFFNMQSNEVAQGVVALMNARIRPVISKPAASTEIDIGDETEAVQTTDEYAFSFRITNPIRTYTIATKTQEDWDQWLFLINQDIVRVIGGLVVPVFLGVAPARDEIPIDAQEPKPLTEEEKSTPRPIDIPAPFDDIPKPGEFEEMKTEAMPTPEETSLASESEDSMSSSFRGKKLLQQETNIIGKALKEETNMRDYKQKRHSEDAGAAELVDPRYRPVKLVLQEGLYEEDSAITITRPTQIEGAGIGNTVVDIKYPISVKSFNVVFKSLTIRLMGPPSAFRTGSDQEVSCTISIFEQGNCYFEDCEIVYDASSSTRATTANVLVGDRSQCYMQNPQLRGAQHGLVVAGESIALTQGGSIASRSDCVKNIDKGETRMYDTSYSMK